MNPETARRAHVLLDRWLHVRLPPEALARLEFWRREIRRGVKRALFVAFSAAPGVVGKDDLALSESELRAAQEELPTWRPATWSIDHAVRAHLLLEFPWTDADAHVAALRALFQAADVREHASLLRALPLLPLPEAYLGWAKAGVRSNMTSVFEAIAFDNAYPRFHFDDAQWNRMVVKALFQDLGVERIFGVSERANGELGRMVHDLVSERRAAGRAAPRDVERILGAVSV